MLYGRSPLSCDLPRRSVLLLRGSFPLSSVRRRAPPRRTWRRLPERPDAWAQSCDSLNLGNEGDPSVTTSPGDSHFLFAHSIPQLHLTCVDVHDDTAYASRSVRPSETERFRQVSGHPSATPLSWRIVVLHVFRCRPLWLRPEVSVIPAPPQGSVFLKTFAVKPLALPRRRSP